MHLTVVLCAIRPTAGTAFAQQHPRVRSERIAASFSWLAGMKILRDAAKA
jgi:hypothetical protein